MQKALKASTAVPGSLDKQISDLRNELLKMNSQLNGNPAKNQMGAKNHPTIGDRLFKVQLGIATSTYGPTDTNRSS